MKMFIQPANLSALKCECPMNYRKSTVKFRSEAWEIVPLWLRSQGRPVHGIKCSDLHREAQEN